ncbi:MAG: hypothetical protein ABJA62_06575 [Luteimonas sp.]
MKKNAEFMEAAEQALFIFQMLEEAIKKHIRLFNKALNVALRQSGLVYRIADKEFESAALGRLTDVFARCTENAATIKILRDVRDLRNYIAHESFMHERLAGLKESIDFDVEYPKAEKAKNAAAHAYSAVKNETQALQKIIDGYAKDD